MKETKNKISFDLIILGGGSAAFAAAIKASELGGHSLIIERSIIGGTCLNRGCVPTKNLLRAAQLFHEARHPPFSGLPTLDKQLDFRKLMTQKIELLNTFRDSKYNDVLKANPLISYVEGEASFASSNSIAVSGKIYTSSKIIIATGASPSIPPIPGLESIPYLTSTEALELESLPKDMIVLGGGIVAVEMAQLFSRLGSTVTLVELMPRIISTEEPEISEALKSSLIEEGMTIYTDAKTNSAYTKKGAKYLELEFNGKSKTISAAELLVATGRSPNTQNLNLGSAHIKPLPSGHIAVNVHLETSTPGVFAIGDVIPEKQLVTTAATAGGIAAENALKGAKRKMDFSVIPYAVFTDPEVASVGLKASEAEKKYKIKTRVLTMDHVPKAGAIRDSRGVIKMVIDAHSEKILGIHMLAPHAADLIHQGIYIIKSRLTLQDVIDTVYVYPTLSEGIKILAQSFKKDITKLSCCAE